jgi:hypothetical protein
MNQVIGEIHLLILAPRSSILQPLKTHERHTISNRLSSPTPIYLLPLTYAVIIDFLDTTSSKINIHNRRNSQWVTLGGVTMKPSLPQMETPSLGRNYTDSIKTKLRLKDEQIPTSVSHFIDHKTAIQ